MNCRMITQSPTILRTMDRLFGACIVSLEITPCIFYLLEDTIRMELMYGMNICIIINNMDLTEKQRLQ